MLVEIYTAKEWAVVSADAHKAVFNEERPVEMNRFDFAFLIVKDENDKRIPLAFGTYREVDNESIYMQYGGVFKTAANTIKAFETYSKAIDQLGTLGYKRASTLVENENIVTLKFAFKKGFRIIGTRTFDNKIYCELLKTFNKE